MLGGVISIVEEHSCSETMHVLLGYNCAEFESGARLFWPLDFYRLEMYRMQPTQRHGYGLPALGTLSSYYLIPRGLS